MKYSIEEIDKIAKKRLRSQEKDIMKNVVGVGKYATKKYPMIRDVKSDKEIIYKIPVIIHKVSDWKDVSILSFEEACEKQYQSVLLSVTITLSDEETVVNSA